MATIKRFEDIVAWQRARSLSNEIYNMTLREKFSKDYSLRNQINSSTGSIMDNIAEGFERDGTFEFVQMLSYSKGSSGEARSQLYRAADRNYITQEEFIRLNNEALTIGNMIGSLMRYLNNSGIRGEKFKGRAAGAGPTRNPKRETRNIKQSD